jgi:hypothetical protein
MPLELVLGLQHDNLFMKALNRSLAFFTKLFPGLLGYQTMFLAGTATRR